MLDELLMRQVPQDLTAEQSLLGAMLVDPNCIPEVIEQVRSDDFYADENKRIFEVIYSMFNGAKRIDPVTVLDELTSAGYYDAAGGRAYGKVYRRLRVGIFFSGDELVQPGEPLPPGGIYNSNRFMIRSLLQELGCEALDLGSVPDTLEATIEAFESAAASAAVILTTGGMRVGEEDHIKPAVEAVGSLNVWRVRLKPGKPLAFGEVRGVPFLGCPGNPVAGFVVFLMMARPYLLRTMGLTDIDVKPMAVRADFDWLKPGDRQEFVRVRRNDEGGLDLYHTQNSQVLSSCAWADGLVDIPVGGAVRKGEMRKPETQEREDITK